MSKRERCVGGEGLTTEAVFGDHLAHKQLTTGHRVGFPEDDTLYGRLCEGDLDHLLELGGLVVKDFIEETELVSVVI